jgi:hypothetical protein
MKPPLLAIIAAYFVIFLLGKWAGRARRPALVVLAVVTMIQVLVVLLIVAGMEPPPLD